MKLKHLVRDIFILLVSLIGVVLLYQILARRKGPLVRIIAFHDVENHEWFREVVATLKKQYSVITPEQFHAGDFAEGKINVLLTFDDGYQSWINNCLPVLNEHTVKGLFFINSGILDYAHDSGKVALYMKERLLISPKGPLTWDGARQLLAEGHTIGGHTVTHPNLALLTEEEVYGEVYQDKKRIESELGIEITDFAYPFGTARYFNQETRNEVEKAGYVKQYSAITGFYKSTLGILPRTLIEKNQSLVSLKRWIEGGYDIFNLIRYETII